MKRGESRDGAGGCVGEHGDDRETVAVVDHVTVKADVPERRRATATLVMAHFIVVCRWLILTESYVLCFRLQ